MNKSVKASFLGVAFITGMIEASICNSSAQTMIPGDLIVSMYGYTNATILDGQPTPITLQEYSLPTATSASLLRSYTLGTIVGEYGSSSEGTLQLTGNGAYLTIGGYDITAANAGVGAPGNGGYEDAIAGNPNAVALAQSSSANVARVAAVVNANGQIVSSTSFNDIYTGNNIRSVYSADGSSLYVSGQGNKTAPQQGIFYSPITGTNYNASSTNQGIYNTNDTRTVSAYNGNLYFSVDKKVTGIYEYGGTPTNSQGNSPGIQITTANNGLSGTNLINYSPEGFWFANTNTLYVADTGDPKSGSNGDGGIQKWTTLNGIAWTLDYTLTNSNFVNPIGVTAATKGETGFEALIGRIVGTNVDLYAVSYTADDAGSNGLYAIVDSLASTNGTGATFTELESALGTNGSSANYNLKGVAFAPQAVPEPSTWAFLILGGIAGLFVIRNRKRA